MNSGRFEFLHIYGRNVGAEPLIKILFCQGPNCSVPSLLGNGNANSVSDERPEVVWC